MRHAFIIGGLNVRKTVIDDHYVELRSAVASQGYKVFPVDISWRQTTPSQFAEKFKTFYRANQSPDGNIVIGNSFGAVVAFLTATNLKPDMLVLCSISPFFKEDWVADWPKPIHERRLGKRRIHDIQQYSVKEIADQINSQNIVVKILYGELEKVSLPVLVARSIDLAKLMPNAQLVEVPNAPHRFRMPEYIAGIKVAI